MLLRRISVVLGFLFFSVVVAVAKKPLSQTACKALLAEEVACSPFSAASDTLLICLWEIDSLSDTDMRWEIRYSHNVWILKQFVWGCEKRMEKKKFLWIFPKTVFTFESVIQKNGLGCDGKISDFVAQIKGLCDDTTCSGSVCGKHYYQFDWYSQSKTKNICVSASVNEPRLGENNAVVQLIRLFERRLILIDKKTTVKN